MPKPGTAPRPRRRRGLFIALLGPDGVGKSSLAHGLLREAGGLFAGTNYQHVRPRLFGARDTPDPCPHAHRTSGRLRSLLKVGYMWLDSLLGYLLVTRPALKRGVLCVSDRYFDDLLVDPVHHRCNPGRALPRLLSRLLPSPDVIFVLDAPEGVIRSRKAEVAMAELARQLGAYRTLAAGNRAVRLLDAAQPPGEVLRQARARIAELLVERTLHGIFDDRRAAMEENTPNAFGAAARNQRKRGVRLHGHLRRVRAPRTMR